MKTSIRELAETANLSQAGLLHYFGSKEKLLIAILKRREEQNRQGWLLIGQFNQFLSMIRHSIEYLWGLLRDAKYPN